MTTLVSVFIIGLFLGIGLCDWAHRHTARKNQAELTQALAGLGDEIDGIRDTLRDARENA